MKKDNRQKLKSNQYCMFYNKFGKFLLKHLYLLVLSKFTTNLYIQSIYVRISSIFLLIFLGKCAKQKQGICPYIHDPAKIAVCTR